MPQRPLSPPLQQNTPVNKHTLRQLIVERLAADLAVLQRAAQTAYETATHEENVAENKYDTLGLEASYLAIGQARRTEEIRQALSLFEKLPVPAHAGGRGIGLGDLITLADADDNRQHVFLGPEAAGLKVPLNDLTITVITPRSPLGQSLLGKSAGDEVIISVAGAVQRHEILEIA
jgi:transcription elongation GreA/GreB family factor